MKLLQNIGVALEEYAAQAKSICAAVALANDKALEILNLTPKNCKVKLIVGVDLPTPIHVLKKLKDFYKDNARIYNGEVFHPKAYIFELNNGRTVAVVGSGNFTAGGLYTNIELSIEFDEKSQVEQTKNWFHRLFIDSQPITKKFLREYKSYAEEQDKLNKHRNQAIKKLKPRLDNYAEAKDEIISVLKEFKKQKIYKDRIAKWSAVAEVLRSALDIENGFKGFDPYPFLSNPELGRFQPAYNNQINEALKNGEITKMLQFLTDKSIPLHIRFNRVKNINGDFHIYGMASNFITKILCAYAPKEYVIWNQPTEKFFKKFVPIKDSAMNEGERYEFYCSFFKSICDEVGLKDFSELDALIWDYKKRSKQE